MKSEKTEVFEEEKRFFSDLSKMKFWYLKEKVLKWADKRDLLKEENSFKQMIKVGEEVGELGGALLKKDTDKIKDGIGDTLVTLIILSEQLDLDPVECLQTAYYEIKNRKGKTVGGTFIKD